MPALTRGAAARLRAEECIEGSDASALLGLRESVSSKAVKVWKARNDVDVYTRASRVETLKPQVDHCLELQLAEVAFVRIFDAERANATSIATAQTLETMRAALNGVDNLNVTSSKINSAKRGPFTASLNRLKGEYLRPVSIDQMARQGRAKWLVDDGTWARISAAVVDAYDATRDALEAEEENLMPDAARLVAATTEEMNLMLEKLGLH